MNETPKADYVFEASWEVCNKVGGIYTVVKSKACLLTEKYQNYYLIGPYFKKSADLSFNKQEVPKFLQHIFNDLSKEGIYCHYGIWDIKGNPKTILIDFNSLLNNKNQIKKLLWDNFKIDTLKSNFEFEEPMTWAWAVGKLLDKISKTLAGEKIVGHFHEWLAGVGLLYQRIVNSTVKSVFTTHATMLGRTIAGNGQDLYSILDKINPTNEAYNYGVQDKFLTEKACAQHCDVFTTVSEITAIEAEKILDRKADVLLLNGLDSELFPTFEETSLLHRKNREKIREFIRYYFFPYYTFDIEESLSFFIVGRYEYKNKGLDILIKSLANLNETLKKEKYKKNVIVFFFIPREVFSPKSELIASKITNTEIHEFVDENSHDIQEAIVENIMTFKTKSFTNQKSFCENLFNENFLKNAKQLKLKFSRVGNPPIVTHNIPGEAQDSIIRGLTDNGLDNEPEDKVKVVFYPIYLNQADGLLNLSYYDTLSGCHLGLFPSYYEPWGYTPLESAAMGVASLTTDLAGFGRFIIKNPNVKDKGVFVLKRMNIPEEKVIQDFTSKLYAYTKLDQKSRVEQKLYAKEVSKLADWNIFINYYIKAHNLAIEK